MAHQGSPRYLIRRLEALEAYAALAQIENDRKPFHSSGGALSPTSMESLKSSKVAEQTVEQVSHNTIVSNGSNLWDIGLGRKLLLVFVRHAGCTFCRETLAELKGKLPGLKSQGIIPIVVHLGTADDGERMLARAGLQETLHVSNPHAELYRAYELKRGQLSQLFSLSVLWQGFQSAILRGHGFGSFVGDGFQLGGAFLVEDGRILKSFPAKDASDKVPFECILE